MHLQDFYDIAPIFLQNLMVTHKGFQNKRFRYGKAYYAYREFLMEFDTWSLERQLQYQTDRLIDFIHFAVANSEFYHDLYKDCNLSHIHSADDIKMLPIVDKEMLRANINKVVTIERKNGIEGHTGGTTGKSLVVLQTLEDSMKRMAMLDHFKSRIGFENLKMRRATFNGKHIVPPGQKKRVFWRYNHACKQMIFSSFHLSESNMDAYVEELNRFRPQAIDGFFTSMCDVANYIERNRLKLLFRPIAIFPTSETLTDAGRQLLERVFGCKVFDQYASSEGAPFITECKYQTKHIELASGYFEMMDEVDDSGEVLVTSFMTHGTPLIRYRIGDSMTFDEVGTSCPCGCEMPIVKEIRGRSLDFLYTAEDVKINAGNIANLFKKIPNALIRAQLIQEKDDEVLALLQVDKRVYKMEYDKLLQDEFHHKFGESTRLFIKHVDDIPRETSGKYRMIVNKVSEKPQSMRN